MYSNNKSTEDILERAKVQTLAAGCVHHYLARRPYLEPLVYREDAAQLLLVIDHLRSELPRDARDKRAQIAERVGLVNAPRAGYQAALEQHHLGLSHKIISQEALVREELVAHP